MVKDNLVETTHFAVREDILECMLNVYPELNVCFALSPFRDGQSS